LSGFQQGWSKLVASIDANTKAIALNSKNSFTIDSNVQNAENEIQKLGSKFKSIEKMVKSNFDQTNIWTKNTDETILQIQKVIPEVSIAFFIYFFKINFVDNF
jgi:hypothetical protein